MVTLFVRNFLVLHPSMYTIIFFSEGILTTFSGKHLSTTYVICYFCIHLADVEWISKLMRSTVNILTRHFK